MSQKPVRSVKESSEKMSEQTADDKDVVVAMSSKGKPVTVTKIEDPIKIKGEGKVENIDLKAFKERPIKYLKEALLREYQIEGNEDEIELEYDQMTDDSDSDIEKEVEKMKPEQKAYFKEVKDLFTIQARLKGKISTMSHLIQTYISG